MENEVIEAIHTGIGLRFVKEREKLKILRRLHI